MIWAALHYFKALYPYTKQQSGSVSGETSVTKIVKWNPVNSPELWKWNLLLLDSGHVQNHTLLWFSEQQDACSTQTQETDISAFTNRTDFEKKRERERESSVFTEQTAVKKTLFCLYCRGSDMSDLSMWGQDSVLYCGFMPQKNHKEPFSTIKTYCAIEGFHGC